MKEKLKEIPWTEKYIEYLDLRKLGLKKKAQPLLDLFLDELNRRSKQERRYFIDLICRIKFFTKESGLFPTDLYTKIVLPEIEEWLKEEPRNIIPKRWSNNLEENKNALIIDPSDQIALEIVGNKIINRISMNQHEIESGYPYDGDPTEDIALIGFYEERLNNMQDWEKKSGMQKILTELKSCAIEYLERKPK